MECYERREEISLFQVFRRRNPQRYKVTYSNDKNEDQDEVFLRNLYLQFVEVLLYWQDYINALQKDTDEFHMFYE